MLYMLDTNIVSFLLEGNEKVIKKIIHKNLVFIFTPQIYST